ncbi:WD40 repeat domain-containing protein [Candidatus Dependentiae bacterium]|nr:WD40 repeat domain-containing protein [Candidatus Dependentiae bacterium]
MNMYNHTAFLFLLGVSPLLWCMNEKTILIKSPTTIKFLSGNEITIAQEGDELIFYKATAPVKEYDIANLEIERMPATSKSLNDLSMIMALSRLPNTIRQKISDFIIGTSRLTKVETFHTLRHSHEVTSVAYSPDSKLILTGSEDKKVRLWNAKTGEFLLKIQFSDSICSVGFSADCSTFLIDLKADITDQQDTLDTLPKKPKYLYRRVSIDSSAIYLVGTLDYTLGVPEYLSTVTCESPLLEIPGQHSKVAFGPDETTVVSGSEDKKARIWRKEEGQSILTLMYELEHKDPVSSVSSSTDGKIIFTGTNAGTVYIWSASKGYPISDWNASEGRKLCHSNTINAVAMSPDRKKILTGSHDGTVRLWEAETKEELFILIFPFHINSVAFSPDGKSILIGCENDKAYIVDIPSDDVIDWILHKITPFEALLILKTLEAQQTGGFLKVEKNSFEYELFSTLPASIREYLIKWYKIIVEQEDVCKDSSILEITSFDTSVKTKPSSIETSEMYETAISSSSEEENLQKDQSENSYTESTGERLLKILKEHDQWRAQRDLSENLMSDLDKKIDEHNSYRSSTDIPEDTPEDSIEDSHLDKDTHELPCCIQ